MSLLEARHEVQVKMTCLLAEFSGVPVREFIEKQGELMTLAGKQQASYSRLRNRDGASGMPDLENRLMGLIVLEKNRKIEDLRKQIQAKKANISTLQNRLSHF